MSLKVRKTPAQRRAAGEFKLALIVLVLIAPLTAIMWPVTYESGFGSSSLNALCPMFFALTAIGTVLSLFFSAIAVDAWVRK